MAGPFVALVGCAITIGLAVKYFSGQAIVDGGVRQGLVVKKMGLDTPVAAPIASSTGAVPVAESTSGGQP